MYNDDTLWKSHQMITPPPQNYQFLHTSKKYLPCATYTCALSLYPTKILRMHHFHPQGMDTEDGCIKLISDVIKSALHIDMSVLMGANIAMDVAKGDFCEATIGSKLEEQGAVLKTLFTTPRFRISVVNDVAAVELCGALKVGVVDGCGHVYIYIFFNKIIVF